MSDVTDLTSLQSPGSPVMRCEKLCKSYTDSDGSELPILKGVDLSVAAGEVVAVIGASANPVSGFPFPIPSWSSRLQTTGI